MLKYFNRAIAFLLVFAFAIQAQNWPTVSNVVDGCKLSTTGVGARPVEMDSPNAGHSREPSEYFDDSAAIVRGKRSGLSEKGGTNSSRDLARAAVQQEELSQKGKKEETVYITRTGERYHKDGCRYLSRSRIPIKKSDAVGQGYTPCKVCRP
jgi:hypothetical protein